MPDIIDDAQQKEALYLAHCLANARGPVDTGGQIVEGGVVVCAECGEPIPPARLRAVPGVGLCVACAEELVRITGWW